MSKTCSSLACCWCCICWTGVMYLWVTEGILAPKELLWLKFQKDIVRICVRASMKWIIWMVASFPPWILVIRGVSLTNSCVFCLVAVSGNLIFPGISALSFRYLSLLASIWTADCQWDVVHVNAPHKKWLQKQTERSLQVHRGTGTNAGLTSDESMQKWSAYLLVNKGWLPFPALKPTCPWGVWKVVMQTDESQFRTIVSSCEMTQDKRKPGFSRSWWNYKKNKTKKTQ